MRPWGRTTARPAWRRPPGWCGPACSEPAGRDEPTRFSTTTPDDEARDVFVDPYTGKVLGDLDPDTTLCIVVNDYGTPTYDQKVDFLKKSLITKGITAVKDGCFIHSTYGELTPSPDNADAVEKIAKGLHPDAF